MIMKLYHYTSILHINHIIRHGSLWKGDILLTSNPHNYGKEGHAVWFTTCDYANSNEHGLENPICDKSEVRFTADIDSSDPRLFKWSEFARLNNVNKRWYEHLDDIGGGLSDTWWLFISPIPLKDLTVAQKIQGEYVEMDFDEIDQLPDERNSMQYEVESLF